MIFSLFILPIEFMQDEEKLRIGKKLCYMSQVVVDVVIFLGDCIFKSVYKYA